MCMLSGNAQERMMERTNMFKTLLDNKSPNHPTPSLPKIDVDKAKLPLANVTLAMVNPNPKQTLMATIMMFLSLHPSSEMDFIPMTAMDPKRMTIVPPMTASGME